MFNICKKDQVENVNVSFCLQFQRCPGIGALHIFTTSEAQDQHVQLFYLSRTLSVLA